MTLVRACARRFDSWLFGSESAARLHACVTLFAAVIVARVALGPYRGLVGQPSVLFDPPWFLAWLHTVPATGWIIALQVVGTLAGVGAIIGRHRRVTFAVAFGALFVLSGLRASRGKVQHNDVLLLLGSAPFLFAVAGTSWRDARVGPRFGWPIRCGMTAVALGYFFSGLSKLTKSGIDWMLSDNMRNVLYDGARSPKTHASELARQLGDNSTASRAMAIVTIVFELGFPLILCWSRLRPIAVATAFVLHGSIFVLLGLDYSAWAATVAVLFVDWSRVWTWAYSTVIARSGQLSAPSRA